MKYGDALYIPFDRSGNAYSRSNRMPKVFTDTYSAKQKGFDEKILEKYVPDRVITETHSRGCDLCNAGKEIIVYGIDYGLDTQSEYHRINAVHCPVCGKRLTTKKG